MGLKISKILKKYKSDKVIGHCYDLVYDKVFSQIDRMSPLSILEIGIQKGGSLKAWREYFPNAKITGVDIVNEVSSEFFDETINYVISDIKKFNTEEMFDIIIDDGSHRMTDVIFTITRLVNNLKPDGFIIIEDVQDPDGWVFIATQVIDTKKFAIGLSDLRNVKGNYDDFLIFVQLRN